MSLYELMTSIPTQRYFLDREVPLGVLHRMLDHARSAASGGNRQGWHAIVVRDPELKGRVRDIYADPFGELMQRAWAGSVGTELTRRSRTLSIAEEFAAHLHEVPVLLVLTVRLDALDLTDAALPRPSIVGGASIHNFMQNVILAARQEGLGTAVTTLLAAREDDARALLRIPSTHAIAAMLAMGYPDPERSVKTLRRKPVEEIASLDTFDGAPLTAGAQA
jgi:nitroreductase